MGFTFGFNTSQWENDNWSIVEVTEDPGCAQLWFGNKLRMVAGIVMIQQRIACADGTTYYMVENNTSKAMTMVTSGTNLPKYVI